MRQGERSSIGRAISIASPDRLFQVGAAKVRLPLGPIGEPPQAVLINTAGGLTGGDRMATEVSLASGCRAVVTKQACEKIYRASSGTAEVRNRIAVGEGAVWVSNPCDGSVLKIDPRSGVTTRIPVGGDPSDIGIGFGSVWVSDMDGTETRIDPDSGRI